jgi:uncharacterized protein (DUF433 family)
LSRVASNVRTMTQRERNGVSGGSEATGRLVGRGIYDVTEIARLVQRSPTEIGTWSRRTRSGDALLLPRRRRLFSFYDLVTAVVTSQLRTRGVRLEQIRDARRWLATELQQEWPLAHAAGLDRLASAGRSVYYGQGESWLDVSQGGQEAFWEVVSPLLQMLEFDAHGLAMLWRPAEGVVVNPGIQAGAPCVEGTRVATHFLAELEAIGEDVENIAEDYDLDPLLVSRALQYEHAHPIAA